MPTTNVQCSVFSVHRRGFTLIEILIVLTIVALMSGLGATNFANSQKRGRDSVRLSDLNQYRVAIENYTTVNGGVAPSGSLVPSPNGTADGVLYNSYLNSYMSKSLKDPQNNSYYYYSSDGTKWVLRSYLEVEKKVWEVCSDGKTGYSLTVTTASYAGLCSL